MQHAAVLIRYLRCECSVCSITAVNLLKLWWHKSSCHDSFNSQLQLSSTVCRSNSLPLNDSPNAALRSHSLLPTAEAVGFVFLFYRNPFFFFRPTLHFFFHFCTCKTSGLCVIITYLSPLVLGASHRKSLTLKSHQTAHPLGLISAPGKQIN